MYNMVNEEASVIDKMTNKMDNNTRERVGEEI